jgi:hypothetical protein
MGISQSGNSRPVRRCQEPGVFDAVRQVNPSFVNILTVQLAFRVGLQCNVYLYAYLVTNLVTLPSLTVPVDTLSKSGSFFWTVSPL